MDETRAGLLRALAFFDVVDYSPTRIELVTHFDVGEKNQEPRSKNQGIDQEIQKLEEEKIIQQSLGRFFFSGREHLVTEHEKREALFPRKLRRARNVVRWLRRLGGVCFVALCNTTALAHAGEKGDLDFFIVTKAGTIWQTRGWSALPLQLFKLRPGDTDRDPVCLSFFVDNTALNLRPLHMGADDVYFRHWFLSLLPLYDDGIGATLWEANEDIWSRHPKATPWMVNHDIGFLPTINFIPMFSWLESFARAMQQKRFPASIRSLMNQDTRVVVDDHVLKFHVEDGRERVRSKYQVACSKYGIDP